MLTAAHCFIQFLKSNSVIKKASRNTENRQECGKLTQHFMES